ncbi:MAG: DUF5666 domain-containing protein [Acidobacteriota bacterium]|nr:DUF5666 domain-containing protein [Acidobacteriota bacterium]
MIALALAMACGLFAQAPTARSILGTVSALHPDTAEIEIKPEAGEPVAVKINGSTIARKVQPGQTDLSKAEAITVTDVVPGDRVLVTLAAGSNDARRIIVIPANDLARRDADDRADWQKRGVAGVVTAVAGNDITVELRSLGGATKYTVTTGPKTTYMRYSSDSVKFSDATKSSLGEISVGDQVRARGQKSADGMKLDAENIVFGTFLSKAGTITAVNAGAGEVTIKDLATNKPLVVKFIPATQVKRMPEVAAAQSMLGGGRGPGPAAGASKGPDIAQMIEMLPPVKLEDLKPKEVIVVSAIRGARPDQITAITFLANAETLVQLAMAARGAGGSGPAPSLAGLAGSISNVGP